ncbi:hypothetical protein [Thiobacillus sedimenti]|uniref:Uncharacterized protein n=1 Tax=Thiobacillus sedimenti TaxID=3110231 RepID=A0ABZ1CGZ8_9PROT|nr:hypothetical protein [Thiobacillus sp. SCUT-2]WRS38639.1 hypothetical protein VA613_11580 [Thiobacillus sp. SCUT-2]
MDMTLQLSRTMKGHEEIFNLGHTLRPRHRQILFSVGNGISFGELCKKMPHCAELEAMVNELLQSGFIQALRNMASPQGSTPAPAARAPAAAAAAPAHSAADLENARGYVLEFLAALVGTKSPAYRKMSEVQDMAGFQAVLPMCHKVIAAVASPHQAAEMEAEVSKRLGG